MVLLLTQQLCILRVLGSPGLDAVLQMGPHEGKVDEDSALPLPAATSLLMEPRLLLGLSGCKCILLAHVQLFICQDPKVLLRGAVLYEFFSQSVLLFGITM